MRNLKIILAYDGADFSGWQIQPGRRTVQEEVEQVIGKVLGQPVRIHASGRTDTGVHALGQVINFLTDSPIPEEGLLKSLNSSFPPDIRAMGVEEVRPDFHARETARTKTYMYVMETCGCFSPFLSRYAMHLPFTVDIGAMGLAAEMLKGTHDFRSFMGAGSSVKTTTREITISEVLSKGSKIFFLIQGSGFLRHMVRNIAGTLIMIGQGKMEPDEIRRIIAGQDRNLAGPTSAPQGLYLVKVDYGDSYAAEP